MSVFFTYNHDRGVWEIRGIRLKGNIYPAIYSKDSIEQAANDYNDGKKIINPTDIRSREVVNQIVSIGEEISYSSICEPTTDPTSPHRDRVIVHDSLYGMMVDPIIGELSHSADYSKNQTYEYIRDRDCSFLEGNLKRIISPNVLATLLKYITYKKNTKGTGSLIIKVPQYITENRTERKVNYDVYCRAVIDLVLNSLPIEMRIGISFATAPNENGMKKVTVAFEPEQDPIQIRDSKPFRVWLHNSNLDILKNEYIITPNEERIINECVKNPNLPREFYYHRINKGHIDISQYASNKEVQKNFEEEFINYVNLQQGNGTNDFQRE